MEKRVPRHGADNKGQIRACAIRATIFIHDHGANILVRRSKLRDAFHVSGAAHRLGAALSTLLAC